MNKVECRGNEIHLWDCPLSLNNHTDCSHKKLVTLNCEDVSVSTTPATTASASPPISPPVHSTSVSPPQTPPPVSSPVLVIVLGVVLLLLLVPLLILIQQNRVMRRATSKRRHGMASEAVYEEIQHRPTNRFNLFTQRGSVVSTEHQSGYEDADELLSESVVEVKTDYYNDTTFKSPSDDIPGDYDDVIIVPQFCNDKAEGVQEEYDDVKNVREYMSDIDYDDVEDNPIKQGWTESFKPHPLPQSSVLSGLQSLSV
ncbi:scavenger receptor cysteine-rich type 1 protein M130-like [Carassius auratus]|uniref:Scavenger receptor cysteine-rich type 1 protein M130-like n=1 Tax=Carassius auratus TaxID=7957 RepID=A0A6P6JZQ8_CARAU|nr:scavenger receptor cysteine-rich type 1 protein M130-like [Carassius auratus]